MKEMLVIRVVGKFLLPYILLFALYIQAYGEQSPGGGFQAGVIFASGFMLYTLVWGSARLLKVVSIRELTCCACIGVLLYLGVGITSLFMGGNFLEYDVLARPAQLGEKIGVTLIEIGVGLTVFSVMLLIFILFVLRGSETVEKPQ